MGPKHHKQQRAGLLRYGRWTEGKQIDLVCFYNSFSDIIFILQESLQIFGQMVPLQWVYVYLSSGVFFVCARLCLCFQLGPIECQSLLWVSLTDFNNGCIHFGLGSRPRGDGRQ